MSGAPLFAGGRPLAGLAISLALHAAVLTQFFLHLGRPGDKPNAQKYEQTSAVLYIRPAETERAAPPPKRPAPAPALAPRPAAAPSQPSLAPDASPLSEPAPPHLPASLAAPPAPTAEEWAFASTYKLKNSKGYRHTWSQQVRSMMGTAFEGPDQGMVRFRIEIAPDGRLARVDTLWSTSPVAERLARQAMATMPPGPPTPTGRPLIFDKTISFSPFASDDPPLYKDDCLPDPPGFSNPFAWDGKSASEPAQAKSAERPDPQALEDCLKQLPRDSIEAEAARDQRLMDQWGWRSIKLRP